MRERVGGGLIKHSSRFSKANLAVISVLFAGIGSYILITSLAAGLNSSWDNDTELNSGNLTSVSVSGTGAAAKLQLSGAATLPTITGTTYYVDCIAANDSGSGTSPATAWQSISKANAAALNPGDAMLFKKGCTWTGPFNLSRSGSSGSPIVISAYGSGSNPVFQAATPNNIVVVTGDYIVMDSLKVLGVTTQTDQNCRNNPTGYIGGVDFDTTSSFDTLQYSEVTSTSHGVILKSGDHDNRVEHNNIHDNINMSVLDNTNPNNDSGAFGIDILGNNNDIGYNTIAHQSACSYDYGVVPPATLGYDGGGAEIFGGQNNVIHHNYGLDNESFDEQGNSTTDNNTIAYNLVVAPDLVGPDFVIVRGSGAGFGPTKHAKVYNNTVYFDSFSTQAQGVVCDHCSDTNNPSSDAILSMHNNIIWAQLKALYADHPFDEGNNIYWKTGGGPTVQLLNGATMAASSSKADPKFVNAGTDFNLQATSPGIDAGSTAGQTAGFTTDFNGNAAPHGAAADIGGLEYGAIVPSGNGTYVTSGTAVYSFDAGAGQSVSYTSLTDSQTTPAGTSVSLEARSSSDNSTWSSWVAAGSISTLTPNRYIQVRATLSTTDTSQTPTVDSISLGYANPSNVTGDVNSDGHVDIIDLSILLSNYTMTTASCDINHDGIVNIFDLSILLSHYGT